MTGSTTAEAQVVPDQQRALAPRQESGVMALALLTDEAFEARLATLKKGQERIRRIQKELMVEGEDYGIIPGTDKPTLFKPGAEKLCNIYGLVATYEETWIEGDGIVSPTLRVRMKSFLHRGDENGPIVAVGVGAANSWEKKHRYREQKRSCPSCGLEGTIRKSRFPDKQDGTFGWWCRDENCKANFRHDDPTIVDQARGTVDNPDPFELENTVYKIAKKRSYVDGTLNATATSGLFTQDLEDDDDPPADKKPKTNGGNGNGGNGNGKKHAHPREDERPRSETRTVPAEPAEPEQTEIPGEPPIARIPKTEPDLTSAVAIANECMRLAGSVDAAKDLMESLTGKRSATGLSKSEVMDAWRKLAQHPTFGVGGRK